MSFPQQVCNNIWTVLRMLNSRDRSGWLNTGRQFFQASWLCEQALWRFCLPIQIFRTGDSAKFAIQTQLLEIILPISIHARINVSSLSCICSLACSLTVAALPAELCGLCGPILLCRYAATRNKLKLNWSWLCSIVA